jgi:hypothetical protein
MAPVLPIYADEAMEADYMTKYADKFDHLVRSADGRLYSIADEGYNEMANPLAELSLPGTKYQTDKFVANANVELHTLSHYEALLEQAVEENYIKPEDLDVLKQWRINPETWGK